MKIKAILCLSMLTLSGCSLLNGDNNDPRPPADWEQMAPVIQSRVKFVAAFALGMESVKPYKADVCAFADQLGEFLDSYDDRDASFEKLMATVHTFIQQIENPNVRNAVAIIVDMAFTESFNFAWQHYEDFINQDQTKVALIISGSVADGLRDACKMVQSFGMKTQTQDIFTIANR